MVAAQRCSCLWSEVLICVPQSKGKKVEATSVAVRLRWWLISIHNDYTTMTFKTPLSFYRARLPLARTARGNGQGSK